VIDTIRGRVASICETFGFEPSQTPFSFDLQPNGAMNQAYRLESRSDTVIGGFNYSEERTDLVTVWVARKYAGDVQATYDRLLVDVSSLRAAVIRDGAVNGGDYIVPDSGSSYQIQRAPGQNYAVLRLTLPVNFEVSV
jgi:hypothetical protein